MKFRDEESGIEFGINYESINSESQREAVEEFVKGLGASPENMIIDNHDAIVRDPITKEVFPAPTFKDMCRIVEGYEDFYNTLKELNEIHNKMIRFVSVQASHNNYFPHMGIRKNFDELYIERYHDDENLQDVFDLRIIKDGKYLPKENLVEFFKEILKLNELEIEHKNTLNILDDFMNMLNKLQCNPDDKTLQLQARDMLTMMNVDIKLGD